MVVGSPGPSQAIDAAAIHAPGPEEEGWARALTHSLPDGGSRRAVMYARANACSLACLRREFRGRHLGEGCQNPDLARRARGGVA